MGSATTSSSVIELNVRLHAVVVALVADVLATIVQEVAEAEHEPIAETVIEFDDVAFPSVPPPAQSESVNVPITHPLGGS